MGRLSAPPSPLGRPARSRATVPPRISARERGYTTRWDQASRTFIRRHPLCRGCEALGLVVPTTLTDHVIPHKGDMVLFWDRRWWQPSCDWHHNVIKQRLEQMYAAGQITADDLWLDSDIAIAVAEREGGRKV